MVGVWGCCRRHLFAGGRGERVVMVVVESELSLTKKKADDENSKKRKTH
jgi:hypothetical protein